jgi:hypothetical protein
VEVPSSSTSSSPFVLRPVPSHTQKSTLFYLYILHVKPDLFTCFPSLQSHDPSLSFTKQVLFLFRHLTNTSLSIIGDHRK